MNLNKFLKPLTLPDLLHMKRSHEKIVALTTYDASFARLLDEAGVDIMLVGDSLGMVIQGHDHTLPVTMEDMIYHVNCVTRVRQRALVVADLPFMCYSNPQQAADNAARLIRAGAQMVKLEGGRKCAQIVQNLVAQHIPVCGHLGLLPQAIHQLGSYSAQGKDEASARLMLEDAEILQEAGISLLVLECIPMQLAHEITCNLNIPTIGIGAGSYCDGQVLVTHDMLGLTLGKTPRFVHNFLQDKGSALEAIKEYASAVRQGHFPAPEHCL